jgi:hypothetical protein
MDLEDALRITNRGLIGFDLALGTGTLLAPDATLRALGHELVGARLASRDGAGDLVSSRSDSFRRPGARSGLRLAGAFNLAMAVGFGWPARERSRRRSLLGRRR